MFRGQLGEPFPRSTARGYECLNQQYSTLGCVGWLWRVVCLVASRMPFLAIFPCSVDPSVLTAKGRREQNV